MKVITAPTPNTGIKVDLFLAGGITNCPDWQQQIIPSFKNLPINIFNPRRDTPFQPEDEAQQILWEYEALKEAKTILFWFPEETLCPITLYELGKFSTKKDTPIFVGTHPNYKRKNDVYYQLLLERPEIEVVHTLPELAIQTTNHLISN